MVAASVSPFPAVQLVLADASAVAAVFAADVAPSVLAVAEAPVVVCSFQLPDAAHAEFVEVVLQDEAVPESALAVLFLAEPVALVAAAVEEPDRKSVV